MTTGNVADERTERKRESMCDLAEILIASEVPSGGAPYPGTE